MFSKKAIITGFAGYRGKHAPEKLERIMKALKK
jgi:hypothetical protein